MTDDGLYVVMPRVTSAQVPSTLKIGYRDYEIRYLSQKDAHAANRRGECDTLNAIVRLDESLGRREMAETLLHEVLHAVWTEAGIRDNDGEERTVTALAAWMAGVYRDNPAFAAYLAGALA